MSLRIPRAGLAFVLAIPFLAIAAFAGSEPSLVIPGVSPDGVTSLTDPNPSAFKLKAGGQIDLATLTVNFAGQASHLGQFTATGTYDPDALSFQGTMTGASGESVVYTVTLEPQPSGEVSAHLTFVGNPGRKPMLLARGDGMGTLALDADNMFTLDIEGPIRKCEQVLHSCY